MQSETEVPRIRFAENPTADGSFAYRLGGSLKGVLRPLADGVIVGGFGLAIVPWGDPGAFALLAAQVALSVARSFFRRFANWALLGLAATLVLYRATGLPPSSWEVGMWAGVLVWGATDEDVTWARPLLLTPVALLVAGMFGIGDATPLTGRNPTVGNHIDELLRIFLLLLATFIAPILRRELRQEKAARTVAVEEAASTERARIARELHDVVSHHVTVMVLQAEGARAATAEPSASKALGQVVTAGRTALNELRRLLGVLRQPDEITEPELEPQPDLDQLPALLEQLRGAGLDVDLEVSGEPWSVAPGVGLSAYRIVQEALTNTLRHSGGERAHIRLSYNSDAITVEVTDEGGSRRRLRGGSGTGLIGMQERAAAVGGTVDAAPAAGGGYVVPRDAAARVNAMLSAVPDTGVVTFLFTDIEDSTGLLRELGDGYSDVLNQHRTLIDAAATSEGGRCSDSEGDGMVAIFTTATAAYRAAVAAQRALATHLWPMPNALRVRMGLHTGEAQHLDTQPVGLALHQAQRVCGAGHGGQVLVSEATRQVIIHAPEGASLRDLGEFELRNFDTPQRLFQVSAEGLATDFAPLRAPAATAAGAVNKSRPVRVLIVDDQELVRGGLRMILQPHASVEVVGEAADGLQAVHEAARLHPDVVLMDIRMPNLDGIEATRQIVRDSGTTKVIILTTFDLDEYVYRAIQAGASGFLLKDVPPADLVAALGIVSRGDALLAPAVTRRLLDEFAKRPQAGSHPAAAMLAALSERETQVLRLMARGLSNSEIGERLFVGENTVKSHVSAVFSKLGARDRVSAVVLAYEAGVVQPGDADDA